MVKNYIKLDTVDSTNNYVKSNINNLPDHTIVTAVSQTGGRGRFNRSFVSDKGGLYMSVLLKDFSPDLLTVRAGVSVADVLTELGAEPQIKWVNDVLCGGKKICGILAEIVSGCAVVGIGVNILHTDSLPDVASSLEALYGITIETDELRDLIADKFFGYDEADTIKKYRFYTAYMIGKHVTYNNGGEGIVVGVTDNGNLALKKSDGEYVVLNSGEVSVRL
jgi:birA, biotin-[acetyl-CoA-carboxylase] ligase region